MEQQRMKAPRMALLAIILLSLSGCTTIVKTVMFHHPKAKARFVPPVPDSTLTGEGWIEYVGEGTNRITVLHVKADNHYSLGYHHGNLLATNVQAGIHDVLVGAEKL